MPVPTEADWGNYQADLDQKYAYDSFAGHTNEEMQALFYRNVIERAAELRSMPETPFRYYMVGFRDFIMARPFAHIEGSDAASCFLGLVEKKLERELDIILPVTPELLPAIQFVAQDQVSFRADENIFGKFPERLNRIEALYSRSRSAL